jgi:hypothetical protein
MASGHHSSHLSGHRVLPAGLYRLTLTPVGGVATSIVFSLS